MSFSVNQFVEHATFGLGKILTISHPRAEIYFKRISEVKRMSLLEGALTASPITSDAVLDSINANQIPSKRTSIGFLTHQQAIDRFVQKYPLGFQDPNYLGASSGGERQRKVQACTRWQELLNESTFGQLIANGEYTEIARRALEVELATKLVFRMERIPVWNAVQAPQHAQDFSLGLRDLIYGPDPFKDRFIRYASMLASLPSKSKPPLTWPMQTIFPFVAYPKEHLLLRPRATLRAAQRRHFTLNYKPDPNWLTYSRLLTLSTLLMQDLVALNPQDMIDIQYFIYFTWTLAPP